MEGECSRIVSAFECDSYVETLEVYDLENMGSPRWFEQHNRISKLAAQAVLSATLNEDEFVKETLISYNKLPVLIQELIVTNVWKEKVFPLIIEDCSDLNSSIPLYSTLFHEGVVLNLLETVLYHQDAFETINDDLYDLLEYCYEKVLYYLINSVTSNQCETSDESLSDLKRQNDDLNYTIALKSLGILCYICDNIARVPLTIVNQILKVRDVPMVLVQIIEKPPWISGNNALETKELGPVNTSKLMGLVWVALTRLLLDTECQNKYEISDFKKNRLLRVQSLITDELLDSIPSLEFLQKYFQQLAIFDPPEVKSDLIVIEMITLKEKLINSGEMKWHELARFQKERFANASPEFIREHSKKMSDIYELEVIEKLIPETPKCASCFKIARKKCSRCLKVWYCDRNCQAKDWNKHKLKCDQN